MSRFCYDPETLDRSSRRSIEIVRPNGDDTDIESKLAGRELAVIRGFYHDGAFWRAEVPLQGVAAVLGQAFNFSQIKTRVGPEGREILFGKNGMPKRRIPALNHVQARFRMRVGDPVLLYPDEPQEDAMANSEAAEPAHRIDDFVYTIEAVGPAGVHFNLRDAMRGAFVAAHRFLSTREMVFERIVVENQYLAESPPLPLTDRQMHLLLVNSLARSHRASDHEAYYLYRCCGTNNCTSNPFRILDRIVDYSWRGRLGSWLYRLPINPRFYLRVRGLDSDPRHRKLVREEFADYIRDKQTQRRKREYVRAKVKQVRAARAARKDSLD